MVLHHVRLYHQLRTPASTGALAVDAAADVAELRAALAGHVVAAIALLDPEPAVVALLKALPLREGKELGVVFVDLGLDLVLFAGHAVVEDGFALEAIVFVAHRASEVVLVVVEHKRELAVRRRAPRHVLLLLQRVFQLELHELGEVRFLEEVLDVQLVDELLAARVRAGDRELAFVDARVHELGETLRVEYMFAILQRDDLVLSQ